MKNYNVIIIGAGAAGLICAAQLNKRGKKTLIIEHTNKIAEKIRISGGGRCNFTNLDIDKKNYISKNSNFVEYFIKNYTQHDFIDLVKKHNISYHEKTLGQLFCDKSSKQIIDMLIFNSLPNTEIITSCQIDNIKKSDDFELSTSGGLFKTKSLVIASGGLAIPKIGASGFGYDMAQKFGINMIKPKPALVPLLCNDTNALAGISLDTITKSDNTSFRENTLFTHKGLSGPAILQISSYMKEKEEIYIDVLPDIDIEQNLLSNKDSKLFLHNILKKYLPTRFTEYYFPSNKKLAEYKNKDLIALANKIHNMPFVITGDEGYAKAEVTLGGIDTNELSATTLESKKVKGLYFIGEVVDVTGWLGGYNFQWAWSSGYASGNFA